MLTLNNLATLLAELPGREAEAMDYVDQAIEIAGEQTFLLDTKGIILIHAGVGNSTLSAIVLTEPDSCSNRTTPSCAWSSSPANPHWAAR